MKQSVVYHGSTDRYDMIRAHQADGLKEEAGDLFGVYAYDDFDLARRFAMPIEPDENGKVSVIFEEASGKILLFAGIISKNSFGYVHTLPATSFEKLDEWQYLSKQDVVPIAVTKVYTKDIYDFIEFHYGENPQDYLSSDCSKRDLA